jgi:hypothetical protein
MTYHLIATTTLSRKNANRLGTGQGRAPQFIASGNFNACYDRAREIGGITRQLADKVVCLGEHPVFSTEDWTYWITADKTEQDAPGIEGAL